MHFTGITIAIMTFLTIGIWHPIVIKTEYYCGTRPWIVYLLIGIGCCGAALFTANVYLSSFLGVTPAQRQSFSPDEKCSCGSALISAIISMADSSSKPGTESMIANCS